MTAEKTTMTLGWRLYGLGVIALATVVWSGQTSTRGSRSPGRFPIVPPSPSS